MSKKNSKNNNNNNSFQPADNTEFFDALKNLFLDQNVVSTTTSSPSSLGLTSTAHPRSAFTCYPTSLKLSLDLSSSLSSSSSSSSSRSYKGTSIISFQISSSSSSGCSYLFYHHNASSTTKLTVDSIRVSQAGNSKKTVAVQKSTKFQGGGEQQQQQQQQSSKHAKGGGVKQAAAQKGGKKGGGGGATTGGSDDGTSTTTAPNGWTSDLVILTLAQPLPAGTAWDLQLGFTAEANTADNPVGIYVVPSSSSSSSPGKGGSGSSSDAYGGYIATHLEVREARKAFPCVDDPRFRVHVAISLVLPPGPSGSASHAYANTPVRSESVTEGKGKVAGGGSGSVKHIAFEPTASPIPTYVIGFVVSIGRAFQEHRSQFTFPDRRTLLAATGGVAGGKGGGEGAVNEEDEDMHDDSEKTVAIRVLRPPVDSSFNSPLVLALAIEALTELCTLCGARAVLKGGGGAAGGGGGGIRERLDAAVTASVAAAQHDGYDDDQADQTTALNTTPHHLPHSELLFISLPVMPISGMENDGIIFLKDSLGAAGSLAYPPPTDGELDVTELDSATAFSAKGVVGDAVSTASRGGNTNANHLLLLSQFVAHEVAHMWFGNLVGLTFPLKEGVCLVLEKYYGSVILGRKPPTFQLLKDGSNGSANTNPSSNNDSAGGTTGGVSVPRLTLDVAEGSELTDDTYAKAERMMVSFVERSGWGAFQLGLQHIVRHFTAISSQRQPLSISSLPF